MRKSELRCFIYGLWCAVRRYRALRALCGADPSIKCWLVCVLVAPVCVGDHEAHGFPSVGSRPRTVRMLVDHAAHVELYRRHTKSP
eukprot:7070469-Prymnesium_polylepis.1